MDERRPESPPRSIRWSSAQRGWLIALLLPFVALALQWVLWPWISPYVWFLFFPAVFFSARLGGFWGGLASTVLCAGIVWYVFIPPQFDWHVTTPANLYSVGLFLLMGYLFSESQERLRRAQRRIEEALTETQSANAKITQLYEQLKALDELKTQFFATVSHELRTPLTLILGPISQRLATASLDADERRDLEIVERNARLLYRHVTDLLDASKAEAGRLDLQLSDCDLVHLTRTVAANFEVMAKERGIQFTLATPAELPAVLDPDKIQRILLNLLSNAFKFTPDGGRVDLHLWADGGEAILTVEDNGPGVPADLREVIFEPFRQGEGSASRRHGGTGLGLFIVKEFIALHGGTVGVSEATGGGARFRLSLPLRSPATATAAPAAEIDPHLRRQALDELRPPVHPLPERMAMEDTAPRILVVEDNPDMNAYVTRALSASYRVLTAFDGQEGLERALAERPDLILSDVMMPRLSGDAMALALRDDARTRDIPIVMLTAKADDVLRLSLLQAGIQEYLLKPFTVDELLARIAGILGERRLASQRLNRVEVNLLDSERRYQELVENANSAIIRWLPDGTITFFNAFAQTLFGWSAEEIHGQPVSILVPERESTGADLTRLAEEIATHPERYRDHVNENVCRDGRRLWVSWTNRALRNAQGQVTEILAIGNDITDRQRIEAELERHRRHLEQLIKERTLELREARDAAETANRAKSAFLANMSHEIRTPLNAITGMAHLLKRSGLTPQQIGRLDTIHTAGQHLLEIIDAVLDLSKIEADRFVLESVAVQVGALLANVASLLRTRAQTKGLQLTIETQPLPAGLLGDPTRLQQALLNYATNAVKFTERGYVALRARVDAEDQDTVLVRFEVQDSGIGIAAETLPRLFSAFEQADNSTTRQYGGTGLGLAITKKLAQLMGGEAGAISTPGVGSTFWFTARLKKAAALTEMAPRSSTETAETQLRRIGQGRRILLAEDEPINREVTSMLLQDQGLVIEPAEDGEQAVALAAQRRYDLILMDMQMPRLDGLEATRRIRRLATGSDVPILALTANAFVEDKARCFEAGMDDFIAKPVDPDALFQTVLKWLTLGLAREDSTP